MGFHIGTRHKLRALSAIKPLAKAWASLRGQDPNALIAERRGLHWALDLDDAIELVIYLRGVFEPENIAIYERYAPIGGVVVDVGANIGSQTLLLARAVGPGGRVIACEPTAYAFAKLQKNVELNSNLMNRIDVHQVMLLATTFREMPAALPASWLVNPPEDAEPNHGGVFRNTDGAKAVSLDELLSAIGAPPVDFIKLDVDGYEHAVLSGAAETVQRHAPTILLEVATGHARSVGGDAEAAVAFLERAGYIFESASGQPVTIEALLEQTKRIGSSVNVIARQP